MCIDSWWQSGDEQTQVETRRHDLSDAMALLGITSVPRAVTEYSTNSVMLRNEDKDSYFEIVDGSKTINIICEEKINETAKGDINVTTQSNWNVKVQGNADIEVDGTTNIKSTGAMTIKSDTSITIEAPRIDLNP
jgi:hypothetical protein